MQNYNAKAKESMLFLTFELSKKGGKETARLVKSTAAEGRVKDTNAHVHGLSQIEVIVHYNNGKPSKTSRFEHPLYKDMEVFSEDGTISRVSETASTGTLTIRMPVEDNIEKLELFSNKKLLTLKFKP